MIVELVPQLIMALLWVIKASAAAPSLAMPGCQDVCGTVSIPYPFGIGERCYLDKRYEITCNNSFKPSRPFLRNLNLEVFEVSLELQQLTVNSPIDSNCKHGGGSWRSTDFRGSPFRFSNRNRFTVVGCDNALLSQSGEILASCTSICRYTTTSSINGCYGINCCQTSIPFGLDIYSVETTGNTTAGCTYAFLVDTDWLPPGNLSSTPPVVMKYAPVVMEWMVPNTSSGSFQDHYCSQDNPRGTTYCGCQYFFEGNPYILPGCKVVEACARCEGSCAKRVDEFYCNHTGAPYFFLRVAHQDQWRFWTGWRAKLEKEPLLALKGTIIVGGLSFLFLCGFRLYKFVRKIRNIKRQKSFFKRNGGLLLQQQMLANEGFVEKTKIFTSKELEKATNNFSENRILGQGGHGTVYKGMLLDGRIVAIKKSKLVDESQLQQFINEVVILSQINHRNVVKLLGCCLETEVPLLIYEFISNGTLFQLIHDQNKECLFSWKMRLQIAIEVARALSYLHSGSSIPIYHRDVKSTNILLDDKFRAKVADFGISRSISIDQTHLTTLVKGTFGYFDPEYFRSSQFTEKSDVYSFGVVLVELLTGQKPITLTESLEAKSLAECFVEALEETRLFDILDSSVIKEGGKEEILAVAELAKRCLNWNGKIRPTMKELTMELEGIKMSHTLLTYTQPSF